MRANEGFLIMRLTESGAVWYHKAQARKRMKTLQKERGRKARRKRRGRSGFEALAQEQNGLFGQMPGVGAQGLWGLRAEESEATGSLS